MAPGIRQRNGHRLRGNKTHQPFANHKAGVTHRVGAQTLGREQFEHITGTAHIDRTHFGDKFPGNEDGDLVEPRLGRTRPGHDVAQLAQKTPRAGPARSLNRCIVWFSARRPRRLHSRATRPAIADARLRPCSEWAKLENMSNPMRRRARRRCAARATPAL